MAHPTLPVLSLPDFPQVFSSAIDQFTKSLENTLSGVIDLGSCEYSYPGIGDPNGVESIPCGRQAVDYDPETECVYCERHASEACRG